MKRYILIAGVNGAGKSTLYQSLPSLQAMPRINTDEIVREFGDWKAPADVVRAGKIALERLNRCLGQGITFNQETTLCGRTILKNLKRAKEQGYFIELHYIGVESAEIAKDRVAARIRQGGHGIPEKDIERRYVETFQNLRIVLPHCNLAAFYDNTVEFRRFAIYKDGKALRVSQPVPNWFQEFVEGPERGTELWPPEKG